MGGFDYGNARLRAMKSRLLSRRELEALADVSSLRGFIAALTKTNYRRPVEAALAHTGGMDCVSVALHDDMVYTLRKVQGFFVDHARELVTIVLRKYDVENLKAILRGLAKHVSPGEILTTLFPVGELTDEILSDLARAPGPRVAIDLLASLGLPIAQPLLKLRARRPGAGIPEMELALDRWYHQKAYQYLRSSRRTGGVLLSALQFEADLANLITVIRFTHTPAERKFLREWLGSEDLRLLFLGPGRLSFEVLAHAGGQSSFDATVETLAETPYEPPLRAGLDAYKKSLMLSDIERHLKRHRIRWMSQLITKDPLGVGVLFGYLALKTNEVSNLRWIAQGIDLRMKAEVIKAALEYPA
jgi:V/A-type H+-transporting ATPase subunit C